MTILELLSSQLDREAKDFEMKSTQHTFTETLDFWVLCMDAKRLLLEQKDYEKNNPRYD